MKGIKIVAVFIIGLLSLTVVSGTFAANPSNQSTVNINVKVNQVFTVKLESNPSTGYQWSPVFNLKFLKLLSSTYQPSSGELCGTPGTQTFRFKAIKPGETVLVMKYARPWEALPGKVIVYHVKISK